MAIPEKWTQETPCFAITTGVRLRLGHRSHRVFILCDLWPIVGTANGLHEIISVHLGRVKLSLRMYCRYSSARFAYSRVRLIVCSQLCCHTYTEREGIILAILFVTVHQTVPMAYQRTIASPTSVDIMMQGCHPAKFPCRNGEQCECRCTALTVLKAGQVNLVNLTSCAFEHGYLTHLYHMWRIIEN